jgi:hypothetical protein
MSATVSTEKQQKASGRGSNPRSRANLRTAPSFKPGKSGNPGGQQKGTVYVAEAYKRLGSMSVVALRAAKFNSATETAVQNAILRACEAKDWEAAHAALKEIADRVDGKAEQRKSVKEDRTITVVFERPEFQNYGQNFDSDAAPGAGENPARVEAVQRAGVRETLRQIATGPIPVDRDSAR